MRPCVSKEEVLHGSEDVLRIRLAALLHFTGLHEQQPVDLRDRCVSQLWCLAFAVFKVLHC